MKHEYLHSYLWVRFHFHYKLSGMGSDWLIHWDRLLSIHTQESIDCSLHFSLYRAGNRNIETANMWQTLTHTDNLKLSLTVYETHKAVILAQQQTITNNKKRFCFSVCLWCTLDTQTQTHFLSFSLQPLQSAASILHSTSSPTERHSPTPTEKTKKTKRESESEMDADGQQIRETSRRERDHLVNMKPSHVAVEWLIWGTAYTRLYV